MLIHDRPNDSSLPPSRKNSAESPSSSARPISLLSLTIPRGLSRKRHRNGPSLGSLEASTSVLHLWHLRRRWLFPPARLTPGLLHDNSSDNAKGRPRRPLKSPLDKLSSVIVRRPQPKPTKFDLDSPRSTHMSRAEGLYRTSLPSDSTTYLPVCLRPCPCLSTHALPICSDKTLLGRQAVIIPPTYSLLLVRNTPTHTHLSRSHTTSLLIVLRDTKVSRTCASPESRLTDPVTYPLPRPRIDSCYSAKLKTPRDEG